MNLGCIGWSLAVFFCAETAYTNIIAPGRKVGRRCFQRPVSG
jgi:hypothetical protein